MATSEYASILSWLYSLEAARGMDFKLERVALALQHLGEPQRHYPVVHIAGTNGKGSVAAMLHAMASAGGYRVGLYTSPHLVSFTERIRVGPHPIAPSDVVALAQEVRTAATVRGIDLTFFEFVTVMAFLHFARMQVDVAIIEVGLGGRLDATNVVDPEVSVITTIGKDHEEYLGETLESVAAEKAGVIKPGRPIVLGNVRPAAAAVLLRTAAERGAPPLSFGKDFSISGTTEGLRFEGLGLDLPDLSIGVRGTYQHENAATALAAAACLRARLPLADTALRQGLAAVRWPGRLEVLQAEPLVILDGAHNTDGIAALVHELPAIVGTRDVHLLFAVMGDKRWGEMVEALAARVTSVVVTSVLPPRGVAAETLARAFAPHCPVRVEQDPIVALQALVKSVRPSDAILVAGSLFLIGAVYPYFLSRRGQQNLLTPPMLCAIRKSIVWFGGALLVALLLPTLDARVLAESKSPLADSEEIGIDAEEISYDKKTDTVVARGNVVVTRGGTELRADEVRLNRATNEAEARGNVSLTDSEGTIRAEAVHLNLDEETGVMEGAEVYLTRNRYSLEGDSVEKGLGMSFRIENGKFTTCQCGGRAPDWSISGEDLQVTLGGYGTLKSGTFNILDVPILYIPRAIFPVQVERQTGLLMPEFGFSNRRGFQMVQPFFWAISKSQDATVAFDIETSVRLGLITEYRYVLGHGQRGIVEASYFNEALRGAATGPAYEPVIPRNRWSVVGENLHTLPEHTQVFADYFLVGDDLFLRDINTYAFEYGRETAIRTLPYTKSHVGLLHEWEHLVAKLDGVYYQNLQGAESSVPQRAPQFDVLGQSALSDYLIGDLEGSGVNFERGSDVTGFRLDLNPALTLPLPLGPYVFGAVRLSGRETGYFLSDTELSPPPTPAPPRPVPPAMLPKDQSREIGEVHAALGTSFSRVYSLNQFGIEKVRHSIEPTLEYLYVPFVSQIDLPLFDGVDRINQRNLFTYGVVTRFVGKFDDSVPVEPGTDVKTEADGSEKYRELGRFSVMQSVDPVHEIERPQSGLAADNFSDVDFNARVNPSRLLSLRFAANYDTANNDFSAARVGFFFEDPWAPAPGSDGRRLDTRTSAGVSYRLVTGNQLQEVDTSIVVRLTDWAGFLYASRYDVVTNSFLDNFWGVRLISTCDCWAVDINVEDRTNPAEVLVRAQVTLAGFGAGPPTTRTAARPW